MANSLVSMKFDILFFTNCCAVVMSARTTQGFQYPGSKRYRNSFFDCKYIVLSCYTYHISKDYRLSGVKQ